MHSTWIHIFMTSLGLKHGSLDRVSSHQNINFLNMYVKMTDNSTIKHDNHTDEMFSWYGWQIKSWKIRMYVFLPGTLPNSLNIASTRYAVNKKTNLACWTGYVNCQLVNILHKTLKWSRQNIITCTEIWTIFCFGKTIPMILRLRLIPCSFFIRP